MPCSNCFPIECVRNWYGFRHLSSLSSRESTVDTYHPAHQKQVKEYSGRAEASGPTLTISKLKTVAVSVRQVGLRADGEVCLEQPPFCSNVTEGAGEADALAKRDTWHVADCASLDRTLAPHENMQSACDETPGRHFGVQHA